MILSSSERHYIKLAAILAKLGIEEAKQLRHLGILRGKTVSIQIKDK